jgi:phospholipid/cholesterol/gamma-HCH transport system permease protein
MIVRSERPAFGRSRPRRALAALGSAVLRGANYAVVFTSFGATVAIAGFRREAWHGPVWIEFKRVLHEVTVRSLFTTIVTGLLVAFALVTQAIYWLAQTGTTGMVGPVIVILLIRELTPILIGLIVFGRSGTATLIELGEAQTKGWLRQLEIQGLDPLSLLVLPRAVAFTLGAFCLATVLLCTTLLASYFLAYNLQLIALSIWDFADEVSRSMKVSDFIIPPLKCTTIGFMVALCCCSTGLARRDESDGLQSLVARGFVRSALAILLVNSLFDLVA